MSVAPSHAPGTSQEPALDIAAKPSPSSRRFLARFVRPPRRSVVATSQHSRPRPHNAPVQLYKAAPTAFGPAAREETELGAGENRHDVLIECQCGAASTCRQLRRCAREWQAALTSD